MSRGAMHARLNDLGYVAFSYQVMTFCLSFVSFLQRVSIACYAERCISYRKSVCLTV